MELVDFVDKKQLVIIPKTRPHICSPGKELPENIIIDLDKTKSASFIWEVRLKDYIPKVEITPISITRKGKSRGSNYLDRFMFDSNPIVLEEVGQTISTEKKLIISRRKVLIAVTGYIQPGVYIAHFKGVYSSEKISGEFIFEQRFQLIRPRPEK